MSSQEILKAAFSTMTAKSHVSLRRNSTMKLESWRQLDGTTTGSSLSTASSLKSGNKKKFKFWVYKIQNLLYIFYKNRRLNEERTKREGN